MGTEIERKFLVRANTWTPRAPGIKIRQGYLQQGERCAVRVRIADKQASLTVKAVRNGLSRLEFEYEIPRSDAETMLSELCARPVEKTRHKEVVGSHGWEIDVFHGENEGLVLAEIELSAESETFAAPDWLGPEVSGDLRYYNTSLAVRPFSTWRQ
jgi:adenylate cyclase